MIKYTSFEIRKAAAVIGCCLVSFVQGIAQPAEADSLFSSAAPLVLRLDMSFKEVKGSDKDTSWSSNKLYYRNSAGSYDSIKIELKGRGHFRLRECYFPPLWIKIKKKAAKGTVFEGNKKLKLVLPCNAYKADNTLILREYLCYKLAEAMTPYAFKTRLVNVNMTAKSGKRDRSFQVRGILIEDLEKTAKRLNAEPKEELSVLAPALEDTNALRFYMFEFLISNTDWSTTGQHNTKLIFTHNKNYISIPYDFDLSGVVDAPYAFVSLAGGTELPIENVKQRLYRGYCRAPGATQYVRQEILAKEAALLSVPDQLKGELDDKVISAIKRYLKEFFDILKNDYLFRSKVIEQCRNDN